jgi:hypothetical protein
MRRSSFTNKDAAQLRTSCDVKALIVPEIVYVTRELLRGSHTRIDLLYTMSEIPHPHPEGRKVRSDVSRTANWLSWSARRRPSGYAGHASIAYAWLRHA